LPLNRTLGDNWCRFFLQPDALYVTQQHSDKAQREREREAVAVTAVVVFEVGGARVTANRTQHIAITLRHRVTVGRLVSTRTL